MHKESFQFVWLKSLFLRKPMLIIVIEVPIVPLITIIHLEMSLRH